MSEERKSVMEFLRGHKSVEIVGYRPFVIASTGYGIEFPNVVDSESGYGALQFTSTEWARVQVFTDNEDFGPWSMMYNAILEHVEKEEVIGDNYYIRTHLGKFSEKSLGQLVESVVEFDSLIKHSDVIRFCQESERIVKLASEGLVGKLYPEIRGAGG